LSVIYPTGENHVQLMSCNVPNYYKKFLKIEGLNIPLIGKT